MSVIASENRSESEQVSASLTSFHPVSSDSGAERRRVSACRHHQGAVFLLARADDDTAEVLWKDAEVAAAACGHHRSLQGNDRRVFRVRPRYSSSSRARRLSSRKVGATSSRYLATITAITAIARRHSVEKFSKP